MEKLEINYKGKKFTTGVFDLSFTKKDMLDIKDQYYKKPDFIKVQKCYTDLYKNRNQLIKPIIDYHLKETMNDVILYNAKWSVNDTFEHLPLFQCFMGKVMKSPKTFPPSDPLWYSLERCYALGGAGIAKNPTNFNIKTVREVLKTYCFNGNYYDPSCGWGVRMLGAISSKCNYFGTDPNTELVPRLKTIAEEYKAVTDYQTTVDIRNHGSEINVPEWENKMSIIFTSPPYFFLEDYVHGEQSTKDRSYDQWLDEYMMGSIANYEKYLVKNGHIIINIKSYDKFDLEGDTIKCFEKSGFKLIDSLDFTNSSRIVPTNNGGELIENNEKMFVFQRENDETFKVETLEDW